MGDAPIRLLLIDDHLSFRQPLAFMLERERDMTVAAEAGTLQEARGVLRELAGRLDVAIVDLYLPDGDGMALLVEMRSAQAVRALVVTADASRVRHGQALEAGAAGVVSKSAPIGEIVAAIRKTHAGEPVHAAADTEALQSLARAVRDTESVLATLTRRERQVLQALVDGLDNRDIGARLGIEAETARTHVANLLRKLHVDSRLQAAILAIRHGAASAPPDRTGRAPRAD